MKKERNYLDFIPVTNKEYTWTVLKDGIVEIKVINKGFYNKIAQKLFKAPKESYIKLDSYGSSVWKSIDDKKDVSEIADEVRDLFPDEDKIFYERLVKFFNILRENNFIKLKENKELVD